MHVVNVSMKERKRSSELQVNSACLSLLLPSSYVSGKWAGRPRWSRDHSEERPSEQPERENWTEEEEERKEKSRKIRAESIACVLKGSVNRWSERGGGNQAALSDSVQKSTCTEAEQGQTLTGIWLLYRPAWVAWPWSRDTTDINTVNNTVKYVGEIFPFFFFWWFSIKKMWHRSDLRILIYKGNSSVTGLTRVRE